MSTMEMPTQSSESTAPPRVKSVSVSTLTISIQTLRFGNRQVTKSAFNQIVDADLFSKDGTLQGEPIGWVNYHPPIRVHDVRYSSWSDCSQNPPHWHVIWRLSENLLRKTALPRHPSNETFWSEAYTALTWAKARDCWHGGEPVPKVAVGTNSRAGYPADVTVSADGLGHGFRVMSTPDKQSLRLYQIDWALRTYADDETTPSLSMPWGLEVPELNGLWRAYQSSKFSAPTLRRALHYIGDSIADAGSDELWASCLDRLATEIASEAAFRKRYADGLLQIAELPQLFIAT